MGNSRRIFDASLILWIFSGTDIFIASTAWKISKFRLCLRFILGSFPSKENIFVIGSGISSHNLNSFSWQSQDTPDLTNDAFQDWLIETCTDSITEVERETIGGVGKSSLGALLPPPRGTPASTAHLPGHGRHTRAGGLRRQDHWKTQSPIPLEK